MKRRLIALAVVGLAILTGKPSLAADDKTYSLGKPGTLQVKLPDGWSAANDGGTPPTVTLTAPQGKHVSIQITAVPIEPTDAKMKAAAKVIGDHYNETSVEKKTTLEDFKGPAVHGFICSFTDGSADPGEFKYGTAAVLACGKTVLNVTLLYNDKTSADHTAALEAMKSFAIIAAAPTTQPAGAGLSVKSPDGTWTLDVPGQWQVMDDQKSPNGKSRQVTAMSADGKLEMTLFLEPAAKPKGDAKAARDFYLARMKKNPMGMDNLKKDAAGDVAYLEYDQGTVDIKMHNLNAYIAHNGVWVDAHVSKMELDEKADRPVFDAIIKGMTVEKPAAPAAAH